MAARSESLVRVSRRDLLLGGGARPLSPAAALPAPVSLGDPKVQIAHLLRRAGFGASQAELDRSLTLSVAGATEALLNFANTPDGAEEALAKQTFDFTKTSELQRWWLIRLRYTSRPLQEKMVYFWHGLLTSGVGKLGGQNLDKLKKQNELFRAGAFSKYDQMLKAIYKDPAMMLWLDVANSAKRAPNENLAREMMELFTLGQNNGYTEKDVQEAARAFTGWRIDADGKSYFDATRFDAGTKTFLGQTGAWGADDVVDIIMRRPKTATYVTTRLFEFFVHDGPGPETVSRLAGVFTRSGYDVGAVVRDILTGPEFYSAAAYRARVKSPAELVISAIRGLGLETDAKLLPGQTARMGEELFNPPNVEGWPGGAAWLTNATFFNRLNFLDGLVRPTNALAGPLATEPLLTANTIATAGALTDYLIGLLIDGAPATGARDAIVDYASDSKGAGAALPTDATTRDRKVRGVVYLVLATPEFELS